MKQTSVRVHRKFDETFKREAVRNWLQSGKSAAVMGEELSEMAGPPSADAIQGLKAAAAKHGIELIGPPLQ